MKELYLVRHAKSSWASPALDDFDRPLNERGLHDAPAMAERLKRIGIAPQCILASPALRAKSTAIAMARELRYPPESILYAQEIYSADIRQLLNLLHQTDEQVNRLMLVGHNYVLTDFAEWLTAERFGNIPTCGVVAITFAVKRWSLIDRNSGTVLFYEYPKMLKKEQ